MILGSGRMLGFLALIAASCLLLSCAGDAKPAPQEPTEAAPVDSLPDAVPTGQNPPAEHFDPAGVTAEVKTATFVDVRSLIDNLNQIIRQQDYDAWVSHLSNDYIKYYSDPAILAKYSEYPIMKRKGIVLQTLHDYFINVVYPSRQNDKVDDIEFVGANQVKAITINSKGDRNILYMLEKHGDAWKIGIGR